MDCIVQRLSDNPKSTVGGANYSSYCYITYEINTHTRVLHTVQFSRPSGKAEALLRRSRRSDLYARLEGDSIPELGLEVNVLLMQVQHVLRSTGQQFLRAPVLVQ